MARTKAEGELENSRRRLAVAQEQIAEFATERSNEAAQLLGKATALQALLGEQGDSGQLAQVRACFVCAAAQQSRHLPSYGGCGAACGGFSQL